MPLVVLLASLRTEVGIWDTADLQTVAWIAGIPYPTGFPLYVLVGWAWTHALPLGTAAARLNALSALAIAGGSAAVAGLALLFDVVPLFAVLGSWLFAFAHPVWERGTYADAHPLGFLAAFAALALAVRWTLRGERRALAAAIVLAGIALALDNATVLPLLGALVAALGRRAPLRFVLRPAALALAIVAAAYAYLPLRSAHVVAAGLDPTLAIGLPPGHPYWDDHDPRTASGFLALVTGAEFAPGATLARVVAPSSLRAAWSALGSDLVAAFPQGLLVVAAAGWALAVARAPAAGAGIAVAALLPALFGGAYPAESDPWRYAFALVAVLAFGVAFAADRIVRAFARDGDRWVTPTVATAVLAFVLAHDAAGGGEILAARADRTGVALASRVIAHTSPSAIVVADWIYASPLAYAAYVERRFGRRIVVCAHPEDERARYAGWARTRQVAILADDPPRIAGVRLRLLSDGAPGVWEVVR